MTGSPWDAAIVGAGPAGSAVAVFLAEHGRSVLLLDKAAFPRPKLCGEYLSPESARILDRMGALKAVDEAGAVPLRGMRITAPDGTVLVADYPSGGYRQHALAIRRLHLDRLLLDRARASPAEVRERHRVEDLLIEGDRVAGVVVADPAGGRLEVRSRLVVGADGRHSLVARRLGLLRPHALRRMALVAYVRGLGDLGGRGEIYVDPPDYAILNPLGPDLVSLGLVVPLAHGAPHAGRLDRFFLARLKQLGRLWPRLGGMTLAAPPAALGPLAYRVRRPRQGGVLLVGDAAGFYDPLTGEGIYAALRSAELAAEAAHAALGAGDCSARALAAYWEARRRAFGDKARLTRLLHAVVRRRWLANLAAAWLARRPDLLALLMGVIGDFVPPRALLSSRLLLGR